LTLERAELPVRIANVPACRGRALRVSSAATFRLPAVAAPPIEYGLLPTKELPRPGVLTVARVQRPAEADRRPLEIAAEGQEMRIPPSPPADFERRFRWPEALEMRLEFRNAANGHWSSAVPFGSPDELQTKERK
jgi:hypothetical protein